jgi:CRP-like cAMP-binding protein
LYSLRQCIEKYIQLPDEVFNDIEKQFTTVELPAKAFLVKSEKLNQHAWFVSRGLIRSFHVKEDKEVNGWFVFEGDFVTSFHSLITGQPGHENLQLMEDSVLFQIDFKTFDLYTRKYPEVNHLYRLILEESYIYWEKRLMMLQFEHARDKYQHVLKEHPHLLQRIPLQHLASYLGITQETLSRIRSAR